MISLAVYMVLKQCKVSNDPLLELICSMLNRFINTISGEIAEVEAAGISLDLLSYY